ncbi:MAG TPA: ribonuclease HII [Rectinemataceae bacterium]
MDREKKETECGGELLCGVDEAGRGPLAGPVCAAAVILPDSFPFGCLDDSKALSPRARAAAYDIIVDRALDWAVGWSTHEEIGDLNILKASLLAMRRACLALSLRPDLVLVDGTILPPIPFPARAIVGGDALEPAIMAASILAKVARDRLMERLDIVSPEYGFARHKGYPTVAHRKAIQKAGPSLWARPGFKCGI